MKPITHPDRNAISLAGVLYALGDPIRLKIVQKLAIDGDLSCNGVDCAIAKSTLSHHFRILRESGIIFSRRSGTQYINTLRREDLEARFPGLMQLVLNAIELEAKR